VDQRGGAPGTRETDLLRPMHLVQHVHAVLLAGGSAFGLAAADGVMRYLRERGVGYDTRVARVPIVPAAILFDLAVGRPDAYPDAEMGYAACLVATDEPVVEGRAGVGTGCTAGKALGSGQASPTGVGSAALALDGGLVVAALFAVNPFGDVVDEAGRILAGTRTSDGCFADTLAVMRGAPRADLDGLGATIIGVVATNARLDKEQTNKVAQMAHDGLARAIRPAHTMFDGDTIFCLGTNKQPLPETLGFFPLPAAQSLNEVGRAAADCMARAIIRAIIEATSLGKMTALRDLESL
jgi:L-aminopeptidase/D-esterase-like protein